MKLLQLLITAVAICCLCRVGAADAAATVTVTQTSEGVYAVAVANVEKALSIGFTIHYDSGALTNPLLTDGPFATDADAKSIPYNDTVTGEYRVVYFFVKDAVFNGGGQLATVSFSKTGSGAARVPELKAEVLTEAGTQAAVQSIVTPLPGADSTTTSVGSTPAAGDTGTPYNQAGTVTAITPGGATESAQQTLTQQSAPAASSGSGTVTYQGAVPSGEQRQEPDRDRYRAEPGADDQPQNQPQNQPDSPETVPQEDSGAAEAAGRAEPAPATQPEKTASQLKSFASLTERFRLYAGPWTLAGFSNLFNDAAARRAGVQQSPAIAVADGRSTVTISLDFGNIKAVPSFTLKGANLKSIRNPTASTWELDALPQRGKQDVRLSILLQGESIDIPLIVIPELSPAARRLLERPDAALDGLVTQVHTKAAAPLYDLNADGLQDYLDDFILTGHWLLKQHPDAKKGGRKPVVPAR